MTNLQLRAARHDDWQALVALDAASFAQSWQAQTWHDALHDPKYIVLVAHDLVAHDLVAHDLVAGDHAILCAFGVAYTVGDEGEIGTLAVDEAMRGRGLGERILRALLEECTCRGARKIYLEVRQSNASAQRLYARLGFQAVGERRNYYSDGETAIVMSKIELSQ